MNYGTTHGVFKPLDQVTWPDPRFEHEALSSEKGTRQMQLEDLHRRLSNWPLKPAIPEKIRVQFETAKNLMLYAWFVFEFQTVAEMQAYAALELALRERFGNPTREIKTKKGVKIVPQMLAELLTRAVDEKVILPETLPSCDWAKFKREWYAREFDLPSEPFCATEWLQGVKEHLPNFRNGLMHGSPRLHMPHSFSQLELCGDLINALFP